MGVQVGSGGVVMGVQVGSDSVVMGVQVGSGSVVMGGPYVIEDQPCFSPGLDRGPCTR